MVVCVPVTSDLNLDKIFVHMPQMNICNKSSLGVYSSVIGVSLWSPELWEVYFDDFVATSVFGKIYCFY